MTSAKRARLVSYKVQSIVHRTWVSVEFTDSPWAFYIPSGAKVQEADGAEWSSEYPVIGLFWPNAFYQVFLLMKAGGTEYYCNLIAPAEWNHELGEVRFVDLELDVVLNDAGPRLVDVDEFEAKRSQFADSWVRGVTQAVETLSAWATTRTGPFSAATERKWKVWLDEHHRLQR